ncbi:MAG: SO2930 family diheme c-type cytochrome [Saprospiraceae bacterium]
MTANFKISALIAISVAMLGAGENWMLHKYIFRQDLQDQQDFFEGKNLNPVHPVNPVQKYTCATSYLVAKPKLSEYAFFLGKISELAPAANVFPYEVNAPLFSDYAEKARFIFLPEGQTMVYNAEHAFEFPNGAVIIKNFFYWNDARAPEKGRRILETRLLVKEVKGWKALEYLWNAEQTDAFLEVAGAAFPVSWIDEKGKKQSIEYIAPNLNQCKGCHSYDGQFVPIGITARQLNREENTENQLLLWQKSGKMSLPEEFNAATAPRLTDYRLTNHPSYVKTSLPAKAWQAGAGKQSTNHQLTNHLSAAARSYLDANCAHCHNPHGPANTSGMFLEIGQTDLERLGVGKPPVAAGRGSGNRRFGIVPGKPNESILVFRMENDDPGIRMPELGRQILHREGVDLIKAWIREM